jgi:glycosyltransferase involved in cell wall biosynthesis
MEPKVSIIVPVYNVESYLLRCIDSMINQTYKNLEIILVNDGSSDNSGMICDEYAVKDDRIKVFHQKNSGVSAARNLGLKMATGEYVGFVDSDDWLDHDMFAYLVQLANENMSDIAVCGYYVNNDMNPSLNLDAPPQILFQENAIERCLDINYFSIGASLWNKIFKIKLIRDNNITLDESLVIGEDMLFLCSIILQSEKIIYSQVPKYHYAVNDTGAINMKFHSKKASVLDAHSKLEALVSPKFPQLGSLIRKRSAINSYNLLLQAMGSSFQDLSVIHRFQKDIKREFLYVLTYRGMSLKNRMLIPMITMYPGIYRFLRSVYKPKR